MDEIADYPLDRPIIAHVIHSPTSQELFNADATIVRAGVKYRFMLVTETLQLLSKRRFGSVQAAVFHSHKNVIQFYNRNLL